MLNLRKLQQGYLQTTCTTLTEWSKPERREHEYYITKTAILSADTRSSLITV